MKFKKAFSCAHIEFVKWILDSRMVILAVLLIFIYGFAVTPLTDNAGMMGEPLNMLEPAIAVFNSGAILLIVPIVFLTLIADFPKIDTNTAFYISRTGRKNWLLGQIIKLILCDAAYLAAIFIGAVVPMIGRSFCGNEWSNVAVNFAAEFPEESGNFGVQLLPKSLYNQMGVYEAALESCLLVFLYLIIIGMILLAFSVAKKKALGFVICGIVISLGTTLCAIKSRLMWIMPMANSIIWLHYTQYYSSPIVPVWYSLCYLSAIIALLIIISFGYIRRFDYDNVMEVIF